QNPPVNSPLLDHLAGKWIAQASFGGQSSAHDIEAQGVLGHNYLRLHEVSREKDAAWKISIGESAHTSMPRKGSAEKLSHDLSTIMAVAKYFAINLTLSRELPDSISTTRRCK